MKLIDNPIFTKEEQDLFDCALQFRFPTRDKYIEQINSLTEDQISRDYTPYHRIIDIRYEGLPQISSGLEIVSDISIMYTDKNAPTALTVLQRAGHVWELEIYNADMSPLNTKQIFLGTPLPHRFEADERTKEYCCEKLGIPSFKTSCYFIEKDEWGQELIALTRYIDDEMFQYYVIITQSGDFISQTLKSRTFPLLFGIEEFKKNFGRI